MTPHILDNPIWNALQNHNRTLGTTIGKVAFFHPEVAPFAACAEFTEENLNLLYEAVDFKTPVVLATNVRLNIPARWKNLECVPGFQMIFKGAAEPPAVPPVTLLDEHHVDQMLRLTKLTNPGPFLPRTIEFGHYEGFLDDQTLVAMAGQRMHPDGFAEISAVCTHPSHLGKGYARHLLLRQAKRIQAASETPFLHVKQDNLRAIGVYEDLGFEKRCEIFFHVLIK
jgi:ribosomal protein S18 acetylase RimI-like enzyme